MKTFSYYLYEFIVQSISEMFKMLSDQNICITKNRQLSKIFRHISEKVGFIYQYMITWVFGDEMAVLNVSIYPTKYEQTCIQQLQIRYKTLL